MTNQHHKSTASASDGNESVIAEIDTAIANAEIQAHPDSVGAILAEKSRTLGKTGNSESVNFSDKHTSEHVPTESNAVAERPPGPPITQSLATGQSLKPSDNLTTSRVEAPSNTDSDSDSGKSTLQKASVIIDSVSGNVSAIGTKLSNTATGNGIVLALGAAAVGMVVGAFLPVSDIEKERTAALGGKLAENTVTQAQSAIGKSRSALSEAISQISSRANAVKKEAAAI